MSIRIGTCVTAAQVLRVGDQREVRSTLSAKSTERLGDPLEVLAGSLDPVQRALHAGQDRQSHPFCCQGTGEHQLVVGDRCRKGVGISDEARQSLRRGRGWAAMLGKPTPYALDVAHTPLHPASAPVARDQACILQGAEQAVGGHLAARTSLGESPDRPGFVGMVGNQLRGAQAACAQGTPVSRQSLTHALGQRLPGKPSSTRTIHEADVGVLQTRGRSIVQHGPDHQHAPTVAPLTIEQSGQLPALDDPGLHRKGLPGDHHSGLWRVTDHVHIGYAVERVRYLGVDVRTERN